MSAATSRPAASPLPAATEWHAGVTLTGVWSRNLHFRDGSTRQRRTAGGAAAGVARRRRPAAAAARLGALAPISPSRRPAGGVALAIAWSPRRPRAGGLGAGAGCALAGDARRRRPRRLLAGGLEGRDLVVTGVVATCRNLGERASLSLRGRPRRRAGRRAARVALGWYAGFHEDAALVQPRRLRAGQRWRFTVRLRQPHGNVNPHGFDYELWLFEQGIRAAGYVRDAPATLLDAQRPATRSNACASASATRSTPRRRPPRRRRARGARGRRPGRDRARRLGPLPRHRRRPPDVDLGPARDDVRVARRLASAGLAAQRARAAPAAGAEAARWGGSSPRRRMRSSPAGACRRSGPSG